MKLTSAAPLRALVAGMGRDGWQAPLARVDLVIDFGAGRATRTSTTVAGVGGWG